MNGEEGASVRPRVTTVDGGVLLNVVSVGPQDGLPIVFLHGFLQTHLAWTEQFTGKLARAYRLVAPDLRGHGDSAKPADPDAYRSPAGWAEDLDAVLKSLGRPAVVVAWSYAGYIVGDYLTANGDRNIRGVVLADAIIRKDEQTVGWVGPGLIDHLPGLRSHLLNERVRATAGFVDDCVARPLGAEARELQIATSMLAPLVVREHMLDRVVNNDDAWSRTTFPVLVLHGEKDTVVLPGRADAHAASIIPKARHHTLPGSGHAPFLDDPTTFDDTLHQFLLDLE